MAGIGSGISILLKSISYLNISNYLLLHCLAVFAGLTVLNTRCRTV